MNTDSSDLCLLVIIWGSSAGWGGKIGVPTLERGNEDMGEAYDHRNWTACFGLLRGSGRLLRFARKDGGGGLGWGGLYAFLRGAGERGDGGKIGIPTLEHGNEGRCSFFGLFPESVE